MAHSPMAGGVTVWSGSTVVMTQNRTRAKPDTTVSNAGAGGAPGAKAFERTHSSGVGAMLALRVWYEGLLHCHNVVSRHTPVKVWLILKYSQIYDTKKHNLLSIHWSMWLLTERMGAGRHRAELLAWPDLTCRTQCHQETNTSEAKPGFLEWGPVPTFKQAPEGWSCCI